MWGPKPKPRASAEYARIGDSPKNYVQKMLAFLSCERNSLWELKFFTGTSAPPRHFLVMGKGTSRSIWSGRCLYDSRIFATLISNTSQCNVSWYKATSILRKR